ncbi:hypothetical protein [Silvibacterium dinghuense]|uniref:Uncharacterized protein n=1 Tax=Silvibacterium dinghuense TaxID=1560006 RepID=A0A4Q1SJX4_9BACT|nr:hypothetical protein [Silvibacterium dinghuense]RXS97743.1 hypothetical protein ESZ00_07725 [Silvibacterium dinghuense]GGH01644.1 hypothetical protein GCM10011586_16650 [Silvibacterium dinghuense]
MNFSQLHERLRLHLANRIQRGLLTGAQLAAQAGLQPAHISNFLRRRRRLSLAALDRVLASQSLTVADFLPSLEEPLAHHVSLFHHVPLVRDEPAMRSPVITRSMTLEIVEIPAGLLESLRPRRTVSRRDWHRFVAVRVSPDQASPMSPVLLPNAIVILDRHYNSLAPHRPPQPNLYGIRLDQSLAFRYISTDPRRMILRPYSLAWPVEVLEQDDLASRALIAGRVCLCISQL